jgi:hypothetical protein
VNDLEVMTSTTLKPLSNLEDQIRVMSGPLSYSIPAFPSNRGVVHEIELYQGHNEWPDKENRIDLFRPSNTENSGLLCYCLSLAAQLLIAHKLFS